MNTDLALLLLGLWLSGAFLYARYEWHKINRDCDRWMENIKKNAKRQAEFTGSCRGGVSHDRSKHDIQDKAQG